MPKRTTPEERRRARLDRRLEALGLLAYQNTDISSAELAANISNADLSLPRRERNRNSTAPSVSTLPPPPPPSPGTPYPDPVPSAVRDAVAAMAPYLSPEDRRTQSALYGLGLATEPAPAEITGGIRNSFLSRERAQSALTALQNMNAESRTQMGPGYDFLVNVIGLLNEFGGQGGEGMSRDAYTRFNYAVQDLLANASRASVSSSVVDLAGMFALPGFSAGSLVPHRRTGSSVQYGEADKNLYT